MSTSNCIIQNVVIENCDTHIVDLIHKDYQMIKTTLGDIATIQAGYPFRGSIPNVPTSDTYVVQTRDISIHSKIAWEGVMKTADQNGRADYLLKDGDILLLSRGYKFIAEALNDVPIKTICSPHFFIIRPLQPLKLLPAFLAWQINQEPSQHYLKMAAEGSGQLSIRRSIVESLILAVPSIEGQNSLLQLDELIRQEQKVLAQLQLNRQKQLHILAQELIDASVAEEATSQ